MLGSEAVHGEFQPNLDSPLALIVDDDAIARAPIRRLLERMGFAVIEAADGEQALGELRRTKSTIVITDLRMPNMGGLTAAGETRKVPPSSNVPNIVVSGVDERAAVNRARGVGVTDISRSPSVYRPYSRWSAPRYRERLRGLTSSSSRQSREFSRGQRVTAPPSVSLSGSRTQFRPRL